MTTDTDDQRPKLQNDKQTRISDDLDECAKNRINGGTQYHAAKNFEVWCKKELQSH